MGGWFNYPDERIWIVIPTIEGATIGAMIAWYDRNPIRLDAMWIVEKAGKYSYSIYLLHYFVVRDAAAWIDAHVMALPTLYHALPWSMLFFLGMTVIGHVSWKLIEEPPLRWRRSYLGPARSGTAPVTKASRSMSGNAPVHGGGLQATGPSA